MRLHFKNGMAPHFSKDGAKLDTKQTTRDVLSENVTLSHFI
jgi:hypothetical protein